MMKLTLENLRNHLSKKWKPQLQEETGQLYILFKFQEIEYVMFFRIYEDASYLQMLLFIPCKVKEGCENDTARLLLRINQGIDVPGYSMNEEVHAVFYRLMLPTFHGELQESHIDSFLDSLEDMCRKFSGAIISVAQGKLTYEKLIADVKSNTPAP